MNRSIKALLFLLLFHSSSYSQTINKAALDSFFNSLAAHNVAMGSLAISVNSTVVYQRAIGNAYIGADKKIGAGINTKYRIGSISKMFTAVMIFQLAEEGKLSFDKTLDNYFTGLPNANKITITHLLKHRSGLHNYTEGTDFPKWMDQPKTHEELLKIIIEKSPDFEPDARAEYSNTNYLLLSYIIEKVSKQSYSEALNKRIISKLGLANTYYGAATDLSKNESESYKYFNNQWEKEKQTDMSIHSGAGAIVSNPRDMTKFIESIFSYQLVREASVNKMKTFTEGYGMGMFPFSVGNEQGYGHNGKVEGFSSSLQYFPKSKLAIAYCTNGQVYAKDDILKCVLSICLNQPYLVPTFNPITLTSGELDKYLGKYVAPQMPITIICTKNDKGLLAETQGKVFEFKAIGNHHFMNVPYGYFFEFNPEKEELVLKESDNVYFLKKQK